MNNKAIASAWLTCQANQRSTPYGYTPCLDANLLYSNADATRTVAFPLRGM